MKDRQVEPTPAQARIPFISAVLHCISMTAIVFLRGKFGYAFLRPKSVLLASCWAFALYSIYAWNASGVWQKNASLCLFGLSASALYVFHLIVAIVREARGTASHDNDSGTPHILALLPFARLPSAERFRALWVIWAEPALVLLAAILARWPLGAQNLSTWLLLVTPCLFLKEITNYWVEIRQRKRQRDAIDDAEDGLEASQQQPEILPTAPERMERVKRKRQR